MKPASDAATRALNKAIRHCVSICRRDDAGESEVRGVLLPAVVKYAKARGARITAPKLEAMVERLAKQALEQAREAVSQ